MAGVLNAHGVLIIDKFVCIPSLSEYLQFIQPTKVTPMPSRHLLYIQTSTSEVGVVIQRSEVICSCANAESFPRYVTRSP
jgi:hypothetical protein